MKKTLCIVALAVSTLCFLPGLCSLAEAESALVVVVGDSNVTGKGVSPSQAYPAQLEAALKTRGFDVRVVASGVNGDTTASVLARLDSAVPQGSQVAVVWVGINDLRDGVSPGTVEANRQAIANRLRARGIGVVLVGPRHGLRNKPQYLLGDPQNHLNAAGYAVMVARTIGKIQAFLVRGRHKVS